MTQDSAALAATSFADYLRESIKRIRGGESGVLPVLVGLVVIGAIFQIQQPVFLSAGNLTNLLIQGATFVLLGMAEVFVLLLGEIDLSIGYVAGVGAVVTVALSAPPRNQSWWVSVLAGRSGTTLSGLLQGLNITRLRLPSFVVTLAGLIGWEGVLIFLVDRAAGGSGGGTISISNDVLRDLVGGDLDPLAGWIALAVVVVLFAVYTLRRDRRRRSVRGRRG